MDRTTNRILDVCERAIASGVTPGGVACFGGASGDPIVLPFGRTTWEGDELVTTETVYDVASLTKPVVTTALLLRALAANQLDLDDRIAQWFPELEEDGSRAIRLGHLMAHSSGFPSHRPFFEELLRRPPSQRRRGLIDAVLRTPVEAPAGARTRYSDLGYILVGSILEQCTGLRLDEHFTREIATPLGLRGSFFVPLDSEPRVCLVPRSRIAPTERCPRRGLVWGEVHDENAHAAGGVCGHAGLFSTAPDLARFASASLQAYSGDNAFFPGECLRRFWSHGYEGDSTSWLIGWDRPSGERSQAGPRWPRTGVGHLAFTGCSMWLAPEQGQYALLLTNRVHPSRERGGIADFRRELMAQIGEALGL